jgi:magnesium transporter
MLINCVVYEDGTKLAEIPVTRISEYASLPRCFVWVALRDATADELSELKSEFGLHELAVEDAQHGHQRPKVEEYADSLFVVMHLLETGSGEPGALNIGELDVFVGSNYVVSVRNRSDHGFAEVRQRCEREPELLRNGPGFVLYALMDAVVDRYFPVIDAFEVELEIIEQRIFTKGAARESIKRLYELKQRMTLLKLPSLRCSKAPASCTAAACRRSAPARRSTFAMSSTISVASTPPSTPSATPSAPRSTSTSRWSPSRTAR